MVAAKKPKRPVVDAAAYAEALEQRDVALSERSALLTALRKVLATIPAEFASPDTQAVRMAARALVVEMEG